MQKALSKILSEMTTIGERIDDLDFMHHWTPAQQKEHTELCARYDELDLHRRAIGRELVHHDFAVDKKEL